MLDSRQVASLIWLVVAVVAALLFIPDTRSHGKAILRLLVGWKILVPILVILGWMSGVVLLAARVGLWNSSLVGDTVVAGGSVFALMFAFDRAVKEVNFTRRVARNAVALAVVIETFLNLRTFNLVLELLLVPMILLVVMTHTVAETRPDLAPAKRLLDVVLAVIGLSIATAVAWNLVTHWRDINRDDLLDFALPVWLILASLPAVYVIWLVAAYESAFLHISFTPAAQRPPSLRQRARARTALILTYRGSVRDAGLFPGHAARQLLAAPSVRAAMAIARQVRETRRESERQGLVGAR